MKIRFARYCIGFTFLALIFGVSPSRAAYEDGLLGMWARNDGGARIEILACGRALCATNTWVGNPNGKERIGDELILSLEPVSPSVFRGQAYDVRRRMAYKMRITVQPTNMTTTGCIFFGMICKEAEWTRTN